MTKDVAKVALERALACSNDINELAAYLKEQLSPEEYKPYKRALAKTAGELLLSVINPIVDLYEDLRPPGL